MQLAERLHERVLRDVVGVALRAREVQREGEDALAIAPVERVEVDRILDKINSEGFASLTQEEKHLLDNAKDMLSRR